MKRFVELISKYMWNNPIFLSELKRSLRHARVPVIQTGYLSILSVVLYITWVNHSSYNYRDPASVGRDIFNILLFMQFFAVSLLCPSFTCSDISAELEKKTFDLLVTSLLSPGEIIMGKLNSTVIRISLLLLSSVPLVCTAFFFGGIEPADIILGYLFILIIAVLYSMIGLFISARTKKTNVSIGLSYGLITLFFIFGIPIGGELFSNYSPFTMEINFCLFKLHFWILFIFELLYIITILFLTTCVLIETPFRRRSPLVRLLITVFYIINILLLSLKWCDYLVSGDNELKIFYDCLLFFTLLIVPFLLWPGDEPKKEPFNLLNIFYSNSKMSAFFVPFIGFIGLIISNGLFYFYTNTDNFVKSLIAGALLFIFIYMSSAMGRWISGFFDKEDNFIITYLIIYWVPIIISLIVRQSNGYGYGDDVPFIMKLMDPFVAIENIFTDSTWLSWQMAFYTFSFYGGISLLLHLLMFLKVSGKKI